MSIVDQAITKYGGAAALARRLGVSRPCIGDWRKKGRIPKNMVKAVADVTGIAPHVLRPDLPQLFPNPSNGWITQGGKDDTGSKTRG